MIPGTSSQFVNAIKAALGLPDGLDRVVIVADVREHLKVYVRGFIPKDAVSTIVEAVQDVAVSVDGDVSVTPLANQRERIDQTNWDGRKSKIPGCSTEYPMLGGTEYRTLKGGEWSADMVKVVGYQWVASRVYGVEKWLPTLVHDEVHQHIFGDNPTAVSVG